MSQAAGDFLALSCQGLSFSPASHELPVCSGTTLLSSKARLLFLTLCLPSLARKRLFSPAEHP